MIPANVTFGVPRRNAKQKWELENVAETYLASLSHSGQLYGECFLTWTRGRLNSYVLLAGPGAFELRYHSAHGRKALYTVTEAFGRKPAWKVLDDEARQRPSSWKRAPFLYLFTHAFDRESPVCRGDGKAPIPMFLLPISFERKEELYSWQRSYYHHDNIWLGSGALEIGAYRQLADPNSELAQEGRELCRAIQTAVGIPTFYYLMRYWGRSSGEEPKALSGMRVSVESHESAEETRALLGVRFPL